MIGPTLFQLLGVALRPSLISVLFFVFLAAVIKVVSRQSVASGTEADVGGKNFGLVLITTQILGLAIAVALFCQWLDWELHPSAGIIDKWADQLWHFYVPDGLSKIGLAALVIVLCRWGGLSYGSIGLRRPNVPVWKCVAMLVVSFIVIHWLIAPISLSGWKWLAGLVGAKVGVDDAGIDQAQFETWVLQEMAGQQGILGAALILLWMGVLVPIIEELFYRGVILSTLAAKVPIGIGLSLQALLFAASHIDLYRLPYLFCLGFILGWVVRRTSSIFPAIALHIALNSVAMATIVL